MIFKNLMMEPNPGVFLIFLFCSGPVYLAPTKPTKNTKLFGKQTPELVFEYAEIVRQSPEFEIISLEIVKYNQSTPVLNSEFVAHNKKVMNYKAWIDGYQKFGMEHIYKRSAVALHCSLCELVSGSIFLYHGMSLYGNVPPKCPLKVNQVYYVRNYIIDKAAVVTFPGYKWRLDFQVGPEGKKDTNETGLLRVYFRMEWPGRKTLF